jgi:hypothetical protein
MARPRHGRTGASGAGASPAVRFVPGRQPWNRRPELRLLRYGALLLNAGSSGSVVLVSQEVCATVAR